MQSVKTSTAPQAQAPAKPNQTRLKVKTGVKAGGCPPCCPSCVMNLNHNQTRR
jgi:hypothetical protein